jgi:hypothetical protein
MMTGLSSGSARRQTPADRAVTLADASEPVVKYLAARSADSRIFPLKKRCGLGSCLL